MAIGRDGIDGYECFSDSHPEDSFIQWLFGWDESHGFPSVLGMLHMDAAYTPGCPQARRIRSREKLFLALKENFYVCMEWAKAYYFLCLLLLIELFMLSILL